MAKRMIAMILAGCMMFSLTACNEKETKDVQVEIVQDVDEIAYLTATVEYGEVVRDVKLSCNYMPTEHEDLAFAVSNERIEEIAVKKGDMVAEGTVLISLYVGDLEEQIEEIEYQLESLKLRLEQTLEMKAFEIECVEDWYKYTSKTKEDADEAEDKIEAIEEQYKTTLEDLEDSILITEKRLAQYKEELKNSQLIAGINGEITYLANGISYSEEGEKVITISDLDSCYFIVEDTTYAEFIAQDDTLYVDYISTGVKGQCEVKPALMENWDGTMYFKPVGEESFANGMRGDIILELDRKDNVLCVPTDAIHESEEGAFVYISDNGMLSMRYVTVGLQGLDVTEIVSGLSEGETVVLK